MPVYFIGHGSPMNVVQDNPFTRSLGQTGKNTPNPKAVLVISAHWLSEGSFISTTVKPETIYDFYGFPEELYAVTYPSPGAPDFALKTLKLLSSAKEDPDRGLDHGAWTVLKKMFPAADIPAFQLSIDFYKPMRHHYDLAKNLSSLRDQGVLIIGSGNIVHNLGMVDWKEGSAFDWAAEFDTWVKDKVDKRDHESLIDYEKAGRQAKLSVPTVDHYVPLLYSLALAGEDEPIDHFYEEMTYGSLSMRCIKIG